MSTTATPRVTLKLATSLDGKIALSNGQSKWITGPESREVVHRIRAAHDAILTGVGTILADDPQLTARTHPLPEKQPDVIVLDRQGRMNMNAQVFKRGDRQVILRASGDIATAIVGYDSVMIEAGAQIAAAALKADVVDTIEWFRAPKVLGGDGLSVFAGLGLESLDLAPMFRRISVIERGDDLQETYERIR